MKPHDWYGDRGESFRVAAYNVGDGPDPIKVAHLVRLAIAHAVGLVGMCEGADRRRMLRAFRRTMRRVHGQRWGSYQPFRARGGASVPIAWSKAEWQRLRWRSVLAVARMFLGPRGAGPTYAKAKAINVLVLRHRATGRVVKYLNGHAIPSEERHLSPAEDARRDEHYRAFVAALVGILDHTHVPVVLTADLNAGPTNPKLGPLKDAGMTGWSTEPTHDRSIFDHIAARGLLLLGEDLVHGASDHATVVHEFGFPVVA